MVFRPGGASLTRVEQENCCSSLCSLDVFQTLKGSLQTLQSFYLEMNEYLVSNPQRIATNHRYPYHHLHGKVVSNPQSIATNSPGRLTTFSLKGVSNPQRIATNQEGTEGLEVQAPFQTLKGSLQTRRVTFSDL